MELIGNNTLIYSKKKDSKTNALKDEAWTSVLSFFYSDDKVSKRDKNSLKSLHLNLINKAKIDTAKRNKSILKAGGGPEGSLKMSITGYTTGYNASTNELRIVIGIN